MENKRRRADSREYHIIYKTICLITKRFYVGMHSTDNLEDGYQGSGKRLWLSINKHGKDNHVTETLETLPNRKALAAREKEIVNEKFLEDPQCMNLAIGGEGGAGVMTKEQLANGAINANKVKWLNPEFRSKMSNIMSERNKELHVKGILKAPPSFEGKKHTEETKMKLSKAASERSPEQNSQFGTCWITNDTESKKIKKGDTIPEGWKLGRRLN